MAMPGMIPHTQEAALLAAILDELKAIRAVLEQGEESMMPPVDIVLDVQDVCMGAAIEIEAEEEDGGEVLS